MNAGIQPCLVEYTIACCITRMDEISHDIMNKSVKTRRKVKELQQSSRVSVISSLPRVSLENGQVSDDTML